MNLKLKVDAPNMHQAFGISDERNEVLMTKALELCTDLQPSNSAFIIEIFASVAETQEELYYLIHAAANIDMQMREIVQSKANLLSSLAAIAGLKEKLDSMDQ